MAETSFSKFQKRRKERRAKQPPKVDSRGRTVGGPERRRGARNFRNATVSSPGSSGRTFAGITPKPQKNFTPLANFSSLKGPQQQFIQPPTATGDTKTEFRPTEFDEQGRPTGGVTTTSTPATFNEFAQEGKREGVIQAAIDAFSIEGIKNAFSKETLGEVFSKENLMVQGPKAVGLLSLAAVPTLAAEWLSFGSAAETAVETTSTVVNNAYKTKKVTELAGYTVRKGNKVFRYVVNPKNNGLLGALGKKILVGAGLTGAGLLVGGGIYHNLNSGIWGGTDNVQNGITFARKSVDKLPEGEVKDTMNAEIDDMFEKYSNQGLTDILFKNLPWEVALEVKADTFELMAIRDKARLMVMQEQKEERQGRQGSDGNFTQFSTDEILARDAARQEQEEAHKQQVNDYFNRERLLTEKRIIQARKEGNKERLRAQLEYKKELFALEEAERKKVKAFWDEYYKEKNKRQQENAPSTLGFGLL